MRITDKEIFPEESQGQIVYEPGGSTKFVMLGNGAFNNVLSGNAVSGTGAASATTVTETNLSFSDVTTAESTTAAHGLLKKLDGTSTHFLDGTGAWSNASVTEAGVTLADVTTINSTTAKHGFLKKLDGNSTHFMDGTGAWSTPPSVTSGGAALLVAAFDAPAAVIARADYACDGTADEVQINAALLASKTVVLSAGTFQTSAPIFMTLDNSTLMGQGMTTTAIQMQTGFASAATANACIVVDNGGGTTPVGSPSLMNFKVDGNNVGTFGGSRFDGIKFRGYYGRMQNIFVYRTSNAGFYLQAYGGFPLFDWTIDHCISRETWGSAFQTASGAGDGLVTACKAICPGNKSFNAGIPGGVDSTSSHGFDWGSSSVQTVNSHPYGTGGAGFRFGTNTVHHHVTGCKIEGNRHGIWIDPGSSSHQIVGNNFRGGVGSATSVHIITDSTAAVGINSSLVVGNDFSGLDDSNAVSAKYAINWADFAVQYWHVSGNTFDTTSYGTGTINNAGTTGTAGQSINNNSGYYTELNGTIAVTAASAVVTHGIPLTPEAQEIWLAPQGDTGAVRYWVTNPTSTTFQITFSGAPTAHTMAWNYRRRHR